jgi:hypothetical protein
MREIRPYGSARGVRSNPYPYRDIPPSAAQQRAGPAPRTRFQTQTVASLGNRHLAIEEPLEFAYELHRRQLIALTAQAH